MALLRYTASADTTVVNAFQPNLRTRGTGANAGMADVMEVFSIYGREATGSQELSRILVKWVINKKKAINTRATKINLKKFLNEKNIFYFMTSKGLTPSKFNPLFTTIFKAWTKASLANVRSYFFVLINLNSEFCFP